MSVHLIPNTGIQFVRLKPIDAKKVEEFKAAMRVRTTDRSVEVRGPADARGEDEEYRDEEQGAAFRSVSGTAGGVITAVNELGSDGMWIPLPYDRGGAWAMVFLKPSTGTNLEVVLAVDTTLVEDGGPQGISVDEIGRRTVAPFAFAFWRGEGIHRWFAELPVVWQRRFADVTRRFPIDLAEFRTSVAAFAAFIAADRTLAEQFTVVFGPAPENNDIPVTMAVDLGNTNTCVVLKEAAQPGLKEQVKRLELSYPEDPTRVLRCPVETQCAFVRHEVFEDGPGGNESFRFLSPLQIGDPARNKLIQLPRDPRPLGVSSPKRYLWDSVNCVPWVWQYADWLDPETRETFPLAGDLLSRMDPARPLHPPLLPGAPIAPNHPRMALMVWVLVELLEQAFRQINDPEWRTADRRTPGFDRRRKIANVVLTHPGGMNSKEIENYRKSVEYACFLWASFRRDPWRFGLHQIGTPKWFESSESPARPVVRDVDGSVPPLMPKVDFSCDEGEAVQTLWLFNETLRFKDRPDSLVHSWGRPTDWGDGTGESPETLRIASIDIGGGTTDLAILDYRPDGRSTTAPGYVYRKVFSDGISRAGDDLLRTLLETVVFRQIQEQRAGISRDEWDRVFFSLNPGEEDGNRSEALRGKMVRSMWLPLATFLLARMRESGRESVSVKLGSVPNAEPRYLLELQEILPGAEQLADLEITLDRSRLRNAVWRSLSETVRQFSDVVDQFHCDLLVVGGRPSAIPEVKDLIYESMAVPPGQVVFLVDLPTDDWYPFTLSNGRIGDAKTCGVMGTLIHFEAERRRANMVLRSHGSAVKDEGRCFGFLANPRPYEILRFPNASAVGVPGRSRELDVNNRGLWILERKLLDERAEAKPVYRIQLRRPNEDYATVEIERHPEHPDQLVLRDESAAVLQLTTMLTGYDGGYWIDTGRFARTADLGYGD